MAKRIKNTEAYSAKNITALSPVEHLKKRLNLTFGRETGDEKNPYSSQKSVCFREYIDNSVGEIIRNFGTHLEVKFYKDGSISVLDNGRGLPIDSGINALGEKVNGIILTIGTLQSGENLGENSSGGKSTSQNGLGASAATMLSTRVDVEVYRDNKIYYLSFKDGVPGYFDKKDNFTELADKSKVSSRKDDRDSYYKTNYPTGTYIKATLDNNVFTSPYPVDVLDLVRRLEGVAYLLPHSYIKTIDEFTSDEAIVKEFYSENGLEEFLDLNTTNTITPIISFKTKGEYKEKNVPVFNKVTKIVEHKDLDREVDIELAFNISNQYEYYQDSYVNTIRTRLGGVHLQAAEKAIQDAFNERLSSMKSVKTNKDPDPTFQDYSEGLSLILSVYISEPEFTSQIKEELGGRVVYKAIYQAIYDSVLEWSNQKKNFDVMKTIGEKAVAAAKSRIKSKELDEIRKEKSKLERSTKMPAKLVDCEVTHSEFSELFLVEGLSACTPLKGARNSKYQALLPLKGKILNVLKATPKDILKNQEIQDIIKCLDAGIGEDFDLEKSRYKKVFIACFTGDTSVKSLDGKSYTFDELQERDIKELWVYSVDEEGRIVPKIAKVLGQTGVANRLIEITLDNGEKIKSTEDHLYMTIDGDYIKAKDITEGTQLFPIHFRINNKGYEEYFDKVDNKYKLTYRMVAEYEHTEEKRLAEDRLKVEQHKKNQNSVQVHHINHDKFDNRPENLIWLTAKEHMIEDNKSEEKKEYLRKLHREGVYESTRFGKNGYNGSDKHIEDIRRAHKNKKYKMFNTHGYNFSKKHNEVVTNTNKSEKKITADKKARFLKSILYLLENNLEVNKENYMNNRSQFAPKYEWGLEQFDRDISKIKSECINYKGKEYTPRFAVSRVNNSYLAIKNIIANTYNRVMSKEEYFNEYTYDKHRKCPSPKWENLFNGKYFNSQEELIEYAKNINHKVVSVDVLSVDETPVYCLSVDDTNNFLLNHGVVVHNCDMDYDGQQISNLIITLFNTLMPKIIETGNLYKVLTPLYIIRSGKKVYYCIDKKEKDEALKEIGNSKYEITRAKGLGETGVNVLRETGMDPQTRRYLKITKENAEQAEEMLNIVMGDDSNLRKKWLEENPYIPEED